MKSRRKPPQQQDANRKALCDALAQLNDATLIEAFLKDLCTPTELEAISDRWAIIPRLIQKQPYRKIQEATGVSVTTVGRVARCLQSPQSAYHRVLQALRAPLSQKQDDN